MYIRFIFFTNGILPVSLVFLFGGSEIHAICIFSSLCFFQLVWYRITSVVLYMTDIYGAVAYPSICVPQKMDKMVMFTTNTMDEDCLIALPTLVSSGWCCCISYAHQHWNISLSILTIMVFNITWSNLDQSDQITFIPQANLNKKQVFPNYKWTLHSVIVLFQPFYIS